MRNSKGQFQKGHKEFRSPEAWKRIGDAQRGSKNHRYGKAPWNKGKKASEEAIRNLRQSHLGQRAWNKGLRDVVKPWHHTEITKNKLREAHLGDKGSNWKGGVSSVNMLLRKCGKYIEWRKRVFERDNYACVWCGCTGKGNLNADHIIPFSKIIEKLKFEQGVEALYEKAINYELLWDINNGRTLCFDCHKKTETFGNRRKI